MSTYSDSDKENNKKELKSLFKGLGYLYNMTTEIGIARDVEQYLGDTKKTSIQFMDVLICHEAEDGSIISEHADTVDISILHNGEKCSSFNIQIKPVIEFDLEIVYSVDGVQQQSVFNLKNSKVFEQLWKYIGIYDEKNALSSIRLELNFEDFRILKSFLGVVYKYNPFVNQYQNKEKKSMFNSMGFNFNISSNGQSVVEDPYGELDKLIGLDSIKKDIRNLTNFMKMQQKRREKGLNNVPVSLHLVFTGNPGTGKTTIARIIGAIYKDIGVLSKGHFVEVDRAALVAGYVGQTAIKTQKKIQEAMGGILFIDEAYTLAKPESPQDFGQEAIDTILKAMEDSRDNFVVIVAGYPDLMKDFINSNPGLQSRFNKYIEFPDYTQTEMLQIFDKMCEQYDYTVTNDAHEKLGIILDDIVSHKDSSFANARTVRNIFETLITNQATRLSEVDATEEEMQQITIEDINEYKSIGNNGYELK